MKKDISANTYLPRRSSDLRIVITYKLIQLQGHFPCPQLCTNMNYARFLWIFARYATTDKQTFPRQVNCMPRPRGDSGKRDKKGVSNAMANLLFTVQSLMIDIIHDTTQKLVVLRL